MTQWLIRKETCRCNQSVDYAPVTDYTSKALSNTSHRVLRKSDSKPVVVAISLGVLAVSALCVTKVFEGSDFTGLIGIFDQLKTPAGRLRGRQRIISVKRSNSSLDSYSKNNPVDSLRTVDIMHSSISDEELNNLRQYYGICKISLINCDGFTARGIRSLSQVESLEILDLDCSEVNQGILEALGDSHVRVLDLSRTNIANCDWSVLFKNAQLEKVRFSGVKLSPQNANTLTAAGFSPESKDLYVRSRKTQ